MPQNDVEYYLKLPYTIVLRRDEEGDFVARIEELKGCTADGPTVEEALSALVEVQRAWVEEAIEAGQAIPEPSVEAGLPSGKWVQRVPRGLHRKLAKLANQEGVSLNHLVSTMLAEAVGLRFRREEPFKQTWEYWLEDGPPAWTVETSKLQAVSKGLAMLCRVISQSQAVPKTTSTKKASITKRGQGKEEHLEFIN